MKAILMCGLAKVKRRKVPNLLLGVCIMFMAALMVNAAIILTELDTIFDRAYEEMNGPQLCCLWSKTAVSPDIVRQYLEDSPEKFDYQITENTRTIDYIEKDGTKLSNGILLELPNTEDQTGQMLSPVILDGSKSNTSLESQMPAKDEVWVTAKTANILRLKVGDTLSLRFADTSVTVKVVKIVTDPVFGGSSTNVYRMWCGPGRLADYPAAMNQAASYLEIRFDQYSRQTERRFIRETEEYFQMPLGNTLYTYEQIKSGYTSVYQMAGGLLCLVSVILAVTVTWLALFLIKNDMDEDIRNIGIYKSLGMTGGQIVGAYLITYGMIGSAGAVLGSILGGWMNRQILTKILKDMGIYQVSFAGIRHYSLLVCLLAAAIILILCFCSVFKVQRLNASHAIKSGAWKASEKIQRVRQCSCYEGQSSFERYYALRGIRNNKLRCLYIAGVSLIFGCLATVCFGCLNAVENIDKEPETWGFIQTDIYVTALEDTPVSSIIDELEQDPRIDYTYGVNKIHPKYQSREGGNWQNMTAEIYQLPWNQNIKDKSLYGARPQKEDEISIGLALAEKYDLEIGNTMDLFTGEDRKIYTITGIFQTLSNHGEIIRMVTDDLDRVKAMDNGFGDYMLVLSDSSDKWDYAEELNDKYNGEFSFIASKSNGENITGILAPAVLTVLAVLLIILVLVTTNLTFLLVRQDRKIIGLLKAVGMTSRQILKIYLWRNCLSAAAGNILGLAVGTFLMPDLLSPYAKQFGLTQFPFASSPAEAAAAGILLPSCIFLGTYVVVRTINRISVKELVSD